MENTGSIVLILGMHIIIYYYYYYDIKQLFLYTSQDQYLGASQPVNHLAVPGLCLISWSEVNLQEYCWSQRHSYPPHL